MSPFSQPSPFGQNNSEVMSRSNADFMSRVYLWMTVGLLVSGAVAFHVASTPSLLATIIGNQWLFIGIVILQLVAVVMLSMRATSMSLPLTTTIYLGYSVLSGLTLSVIFAAFTMSSIAQALFITSFAFGGLSIFGYVTKRDLGPIGSFCTIGLFGLIGFYLITMFFPSLMTESVSKATSVIGIMIFAGLTAYDTQKIKSFNSADPVENRKQAIRGALVLYLDFINLFISILRLTGDRR